MSDFQIKSKTPIQPSTVPQEIQAPKETEPKSITTGTTTHKPQLPGLEGQKQLENSDHALASLSKAQQKISPVQVGENALGLSETLSQPLSQTGEIPVAPGPYTKPKPYQPGEKTELGKQMELVRQKTRPGEGSYQTQLRMEHAALSQEFDRISLGAVGSSKAMRLAEKQLTAIDQRMSEIEKQIQDYKPHTRADMLRQFERSDGGNIFRKLYDQAISHGVHDDGHSSLWQKVKHSLLENEDTQSSLHMRALTDMRKQYVNNLVQEVLNDLLQQLPEGQEKKDLQAQLLKANAFGSTNLTSDYDVIMGALSKHVVHLEARVVEEFNARFSKAFGVEGGEFFDTNVYTRGLAPNSSEELGPNKDGVGGSGPYKWSNPEAQQLHDRQQDIMSLVKQRKFMSQPEWDGYVKDLASQLPETGRKDLLDRYGQADTIYKAAAKELDDMQAELRTQTKYKDLRPDALELAASNRLYEAKLKIVNQVSSNPDKVDQDTLKARVSFAMSQALLFANEPYFSEGTLRHVVGNEQELGNAKSKLQLSPVQGLQSFNENLGDTVKELGHLEGKPVGEVAFHSSKYIGRFCRAIDVILEARGEKDAPPKELEGPIAIQKALLSITNDLQQIRGGNLSKVPEGTSPSDHARNLLHQALGPLVPGTIPKLPESTGDLQTMLLGMARDVNSFVRPRLG